MGQKVASLLTWTESSSEWTPLYSVTFILGLPHRKEKIPEETHFKETRPRFIRNALVKAAIPLLLMELLCSLVDGGEKKSQLLNTAMQI